MNVLNFPFSIFIFQFCKMNKARRKYFRNQKWRAKKKLPLYKRFFNSILLFFVSLGTAFYSIFVLLKQIWLYYVPFLTYFLTAVGKRAFITADSKVLAFKDESIMSLIAMVVFVVLILANCFINRIEKHKLSKKQQEKKEKRVLRFLIVSAVMSLLVAIFSFFPRQVLYADHIETRNALNMQTESLSLATAHISRIGIEKERSRYSTNYKLRVTVQGENFRRGFRIRADKLLTLNDALFSERNPLPDIFGTEYCEPYIRSHKNLTERERKFLADVFTKTD